MQESKSTNYHESLAELSAEGAYRRNRKDLPRDINVFLDYLPEARAEKATYKDIMNYVDHLRKQYQNPRTINRMLYGVKAWYHWLIQTGKREDHPCRYLTLKDAKYQDIQLQDLLLIRIEQLMERKERYESVRIRNQVAISY